MDRSWFDSEDMGLGLGLDRHWGTSTASLFDEARGLEIELQASSQRLRESARLAVGGHTRRSDLAHRINTFMRNTGDGVKCSQGEYEELNKNLRAIKEENLKLKAVINDVTEVNKRWQKYNNDRQMYVQRLLTTIQDQQDQINKMVANRAFATPVVEAVEASPLHDVVAGLERQIEQLDLEHGETVEVLKFQLKAHHDDWEAERREKQQALQDKLAAEAKIRQLQKELRAHKLKLREDRLETADGRCNCCCPHACETEPEPRLSYCRSNENTKTYRTSVHVPCNAGHLLSRGTTLSFDDDLAMDGDKSKAECRRTDESPPPDTAPNAVRMGFGGDGLASVLSFPQTIVKSHSLPNPSETDGTQRPVGPAAVSAESLLPRKPRSYQEGVDTQTRQDIICPVCDRLFPPTSHVKFLDHFGRCQDNAAIGQRL